ncbi:N-acetyltransferase family protein [Pseudonocardia sichuanensis]
MTNDDLVLRSATTHDWPAIWPVWHAVVATGESIGWDPSTDEPTARALWMRPPPTTVFVAERGAPSPNPEPEVVGTAKLAPDQPGLGDHVAGASFLVHPDATGAGIGRALAEHVLAQAQLQGYRAMRFNAVVETNTRAVALWTSLGFTVVGTVPEAFRHPRHGLVGMHVMHRRL